MTTCCVITVSLSGNILLLNVYSTQADLWHNYNILLLNVYSTQANLWHNCDVLNGGIYLHSNL
jgi:hypothetical protein